MSCDYADLKGFCRWMLQVDRDPPREHWRCVTCGDVRDRKPRPAPAEGPGLRVVMTVTGRQAASCKGRGASESLTSDAGATRS